MGGASSYIAILCIAGFLSAAWFATKLSKMAGVSSIVLEITTGVILGPSVLGLISDEYAKCEHKTHANCKVPVDFEKKLAEGLPMGATMGRIMNGDACSYWEHHAVSHGEEHGMEHGADHGAGHGTDVGTEHVADHGGDAEGGHAGEHGEQGEPQAGWWATGVDDEAPVGSASGTQGEPSNNDVAHGGSEGHGAAHGGAEGHDNTSHGSAEGHDASHSESAGGHHEEPHAGGGAHGVALGEHRRLSGGGGGEQYTSYPECLEKSCEAEVSHDCGLTPDVFTLIGHAGVALMIFESGMHFDFERAAVVGPKACAVAVLGTILPLISGTILTVLYGKPFMPDAVSVGTALAPTSVGIALRLLGEAGVLSHDFGQAIITAAFVDDILSLVLFNVLFSLRGEFDVIKVVVFPIVGIVFMIVAMIAAVKFWPNAIENYILPRIPLKKGEFKVSSKDEALFLIMFVLLVVYATTTHFLGTHLWGCFIAGMSFACVKPLHHPHHIWVKQTKRITSWMIRIFFSATVAFSIPVSKLLSIDAFLKGSLMGIGPCILTKVLCAPFMGDAKFVIGWAMVGRAEFAYLIAQMAAAANMIDEETFSIAIWSLLYATIFAPFVFRTVLNRYIARNNILGEPSAELEDIEDDDKGFIADHHETHASEKSKPDYAANEVATSTYGKALPELEDVKLDLDSAPDQPAAKDQKQPARQAPNKGKGFLCCLFFNNAVMQ